MGLRLLPSIFTHGNRALGGAVGVLALVEGALPFSQNALALGQHTFALLSLVRVPVLGNIEMGRLRLLGVLWCRRIRGHHGGRGDLRRGVVVEKMRSPSLSR